MASRPIQWVNAAVLMQALERYEQGVLARPLQLWLEALLELDPKARGTAQLRPARIRSDAIAAP
jgi:hypothetical protein